MNKVENVLESCFKEQQCRQNLSEFRSESQINFLHSIQQFIEIVFDDYLGGVPSNV